MTKKLKVRGEYAMITVMDSEMNGPRYVQVRREDKLKGREIIFDLMLPPFPSFFERIEDTLTIFQDE